MTAGEFRLCDVSLGRSFGGRGARTDREHDLAIGALLECNTFIPAGHSGGPYRLRIEVADERLALHIADETGAHVASHHISLTPFRRLFSDYTRICENYYEAVRRPGPDRLEAIDMGRRGIHNEASELLKERLATKAKECRDREGSHPRANKSKRIKRVESFLLNSANAPTRRKNGRCLQDQNAKLKFGMKLLGIRCAMSIAWRTAPPSVGTRANGLAARDQ